MVTEMTKKINFKKYSQSASQHKGRIENSEERIVTFIPFPEHSGVAPGARCDDSVSALGSRRSLADTSVTSTADLSVFSSGRSHAPDNSLDTHSNVSDDGTGSDG